MPRLLEPMLLRSALVACSVLISLLLLRARAVAGEHDRGGSDTVLVFDEGTLGRRAAARLRAAAATSRVPMARLPAPARRDLSDVGLHDRPEGAGRRCARGPIPGPPVAACGGERPWAGDRTPANGPTAD